MGLSLTSKPLIMTIKKAFFLILTAMTALGICAQVPQFSSKNFSDWTYNNPAIALTQSNILANRIVLYKTTTGLNLTLTSPEFNCAPGQIIDMKVTWITDQWQTANFNVSKVALTAALLNDKGVAVDSVTFAPDSVSRTNYIYLSLTVPQGLTTARLRFASWKGDVNSSGAVRQIDTSSLLFGDVNLDGEVSVADVNAVLDVILGGNSDEGLRQRADVNRDGEVSVADMNCVVDVITGST